MRRWMPASSLRVSVRSTTEIAAYGTLVAWARGMGHTEAERLLQRTLEEEKAADEKLTSLAESGINQDAAATVRAGASSRSKSNWRRSVPARDASRGRRPRRRSCKRQLPM